jgi:hypothetical protein
MRSLGQKPDDCTSLRRSWPRGIGGRINLIARAISEGRGAALWLLSGMVIVATLATIAVASSVHFKHGSPSFIDNGLTLTAVGVLAGLGNEDIVVALTADANPTATCSNPSGANQPPGHNPAPVQVTGSEAIPAGEIKNGNVAFNVSTQPPTSPIPGAPDCPNSNWTEAITDMSFTCADVQVQQPPGTSVLEQCFSLSGPAGGKTSGPLTATPVRCPC